MVALLATSNAGRVQQEKTIAASRSPGGMIGNVLKEIVPPDTGLAFTAMRELRTSLASMDQFVEQVDTIQRPDGYRLVGVIPDDGIEAVAVAGFRLGTSLSWGRHLYIAMICPPWRPPVAGVSPASCSPGLTTRPSAWAATRCISIPASDRAATQPTAFISTSAT